jgi:hypothetical protein
LKWQAVSTRFDFVVSFLVSLLHSLRFSVRSRAALHLEILALRHQLAVVTVPAVHDFG